MEDRAKRVNGPRNLIRIVGGDIVKLYPDEECLCYDYPGLKDTERFFLSRRSTTAIIEGGVWVIFDDIYNFNFKRGQLVSNPFNKPAKMFSDAEVERLIGEGKTFEEIGALGEIDIPATQDGLFKYGIRLVLKKTEDERCVRYVNPEKYDEFNKALRDVNL